VVRTPAPCIRSQTSIRNRKLRHTAVPIIPPVRPFVQPFFAGLAGGAGGGVWEYARRRAGRCIWMKNPYTAFFCALRQAGAEFFTGSPASAREGAGRACAQRLRTENILQNCPGNPRRAGFFRAIFLCGRRPEYFEYGKYPRVFVLAGRKNHPGCRRIVIPSASLRKRVSRRQTPCRNIWRKRRLVLKAFHGFRAPKCRRRQSR
jgi:hypothetical protein